MTKGKLVITVNKKAITVKGHLKNANKAVEMAVIHGLIRSLGFTGDSLIEALQNISEVERTLMGHKESEEPEESEETTGGEINES